MSLLSNRLDAMFEDTSVRINPIEVALETIQKLDSAKQLVFELQNQLVVSQRGMAGDLALNTRRKHPSLNIGVNDTGCKIGYKSTNLNFSPDIKHGVWALSSDDDTFLNEFIDNNPSAIVLHQNTNILATAVFDHFFNHYKILGEDIMGQGVVMVEGKRANQLDVVSWKNCSRPRLMSRKTRGLS